jgi:hypothetical protein
MTEPQTYSGSCHCGRIRFEVTTDLTRASECNCSVCRKKGYLHHMVPPERFRLLAGADDLTTYQFGTFKARHLFCRNCGIAPFYRPRADPAKYMINVRCLDGVDYSKLRIEKFDGQSWELKPGAPYTGIWKDSS